MTKQQQRQQGSKTMTMKMEETKQRPRFLQALFHPQHHHEEEKAIVVEVEAQSNSSSETCAAGVMKNEKHLLLFLTSAVVSCLLLTVLCVWQWKKRRNLRRRRSGTRGSISLQESSLFLQVESEHESLVAALQEELHAKSVAENEQAILWRQEKRILQSRIDELLEHTKSNSRRSVPSSGEEKKDDARELHEAQLLQQVKELQETVTFLTNLTESQTAELEAKNNEIVKLNNILEEMQQLMGGVERRGGAAEQQAPVSPGKLAFQMTVSQSADTEDMEEEDSDADSISIDSSADGLMEKELGKSRLPEGNKLVLLMSSMSGNLSTSMHQTRVETIFRNGLHLEARFLETIDGCNQELTSLRNDLFEISGQRAVYPQVFLVKDGDIEFVGDYDTVQGMHDSRELPERIGLILPEGEGKENTMATTESDNKYDKIGAVLLDTNTAGIAGREASKQIMMSKNEKLADTGRSFETEQQTAV